MHIYIHIPFCVSKCPYCAFGSHEDSFKKVKTYFDALKFEIKNFIANNRNLNISTIFIGGGTPSAVNASYYEEIFEILKPNLNENTEITSEANPNSSNLKWLCKMKKYGVNRISFGAQSFNDEKLKFLGRSHDSKDIFKAVENARIAGFKNINTDIIYDTKFDSKKFLQTEIKNLEKLYVSHVSAYSLTLEKNTPFYKHENFKKNSFSIAKFVFKEIENLGFKQYEISNFGNPCRHNLGYWKQNNYIGFGAYSVGFMKNQRFYAPKNLDEYIKTPTKKIVENLSKYDLKLEHIFLGARSVVGIDPLNLNSKELENANFLVKKRKLIFKKNKFYNPNFLLADEVALFITSQI